VWKSTPLSAVKPKRYLPRMKMGFGKFGTPCFRMHAEAAYKSAFVGGVRYAVALPAERVVVVTRLATPALRLPPPHPVATSPTPTAADRKATAECDRFGDTTSHPTSRV
jgi:hypothetical protein